ncbi:MAG: hypothetical protein ACXWLH_03025 [Candidatus Saccharimonadales bacterium]
MKSYARIIGEVPEAHRDVFALELPPHGDNPGVANYKTFWGYGEHISADKLEEPVQPFMPVIKAALKLGRVSLLPQTYLEAQVLQGDAYDMGNPDDLKLHSEGIRGIFRRIIVSDKFATLYTRPNGQITPAPDFSFLSFDAHAQHAAQKTGQGQRKTTVRVTLGSRPSQKVHLSTRTFY